MRRNGESFLLRRVAEDAAERLTDINRQFQSAVFVGLPAFRKCLIEALPDHKKPARIAEFDDWPDPFSKIENVDLIISGLVLQSLNDVPGAIVQARQALSPDGLFLASIIGGESLLRLKRACFAADHEKYGGIIPRVAPMIDLQQAALLLSRAGLAQPVIDKDACKVSYSKISTLVEDLRDIGETNRLLSYRAKYEGRHFMDRLERGYGDKDEAGKFRCLFELVWMTGWAPHESQQKPLKPGSAKMRLSDALKQIRD